MHAALRAAEGDGAFLHGGLQLHAALGQLRQCLPEIWLDYDEHAPRARALLQELQDLPQRRWACRCGEIVEGGFEQCWQCGALMPRD